jgi:eukaryotic-like serine/threonine-protein kinase
MLSPGDRVGDWVVDRELGRGGMAIVYRVSHVQSGRIRALKLLQTLNAEVRRRTALEARTQARLKHPNVVGVHGVLDVDGRPGLLMDSVAGPNLEQWRRGRAFTPDEADRFFRGVVAGVGAAHRAGLVHRDIKPANVLVGPDDQVFVTDFGLVKVLEGDTPGQTRTGATMGTPGFMAPEQIRRARHADQRADVFALGCLLYWLHADQPPFIGTHSLAVMQATVAGRYLPLDEVAGVAPPLPLVAAAIQGCLQPHVDDRIPDCSTLIAVLEGRVTWRVRTPATGVGAETLGSLVLDGSGENAVTFGGDGELTFTEDDCPPSEGAV